MNGIIGMTNLVLASELSAEQSEYLDLARTSAESLHSLLNDILDFSKIEAGRLELCPTQFSLRQCIERVQRVTHGVTRDARQFVDRMPIAGCDRRGAKLLVQSAVGGDQIAQRHQPAACLRP